MSLRATLSPLLLCLSSVLAAQVLVPAVRPAPAEPRSQPAAPAPTPSAPGPYTISGTIVSATTGALLDRAEVTLSTAGTQTSRIAATTTGESGTFRFDDLAAGKYTLQAFRRGYLTAGYQDHEGFETAIVTGPDLDSRNIRFPLYPGAVIGGIVTSDSGEPVGGARVTLYRQTHDNGEGSIVSVRSEMTDDIGSYEFFRLRPGSYYISVTATPWYAFHPALKNDADGNPLPADQQPHSPLDVAYATTFFPNATDAASATLIALNAGDRIEADLSLHAIPAIHILIRMPQPNDTGRGISLPQLTTEVFGTEQNQFYSHISVTGRPDSQVADIGGIAPGHYTLREFGPQGRVNDLTVDLTTSQIIDFNTGSGNVEVSGKLAMASGQKLPAGITASLVPENEGSFGGPGPMFGTNARVAADGSFDFHSVAPGTYELEVHSSGRALVVARMAASGAEIHGGRFTVTGDAVLLAATLLSGSTTITGYAQSGGKGIGGVMILLVPADPNASRELCRRDQSDSDGSFLLRRVVPGAYTLVAIQDGWTLDWAHPDVIAPYLAHGLKLLVSDQQKTFTLPEPLTVQPR